jgi:hypothetical protein
MIWYEIKLINWIIEQRMVNTKIELKNNMSLRWPIILTNTMFKVVLLLMEELFTLVFL